MKQNKYFIGLTGSIATGKSAATAYLKMLGYFVIDADSIAKEVVCFPKVKQKMMEVFGSDIYFEDNLKREQLATMIFHNKELREKLNSILHPVIYAEMKKASEECKEKIVFFDIPLLVETKWEAEQYGLVFDEIWMIYIPENLQIKRLMQRDRIAMEYAKKKVISQMDVEEKKKHCDIILDNSATLEELYRKLDKEIERVQKR